MLELVISVVIATVLLGSVGVTVMRADRAFRATQSSAETERVCERVLERIAREFLDADRNSITLTPAAPLLGTSVSFRRAQGWNAGAMELSPQRRVRFELDPAELNDGLDNDADGSIDEGRITIEMDTSVAGGALILVDGVREFSADELANGLDDNGDLRVDEPGFFATYDAVSSTLFLRLTLERRDSDGVLVARTAQLSVRLRNG